jgi:hypothetical protein
LHVDLGFHPPSLLATSGDRMIQFEKKNKMTVGSTPSLNLLRRRCQVGRVDLRSPDAAFIVVLGFAATARVNYSEPPGAFEIMESISVRADGGCTPPTPRRRYPLGRVERGTIGFDLCSPDAASIAILGFAATARVNYSEPPGAFEIMESISVRADGGLHLPTPCRRYQVGRVYRYIPIQSLSPFWGSPQRQGQAKRCPWECFILHVDMRLQRQILRR